MDTKTHLMNQVMSLFDSVEKTQKELQEIRETKSLISQSYASREADLERRLREAQKALSEQQMTAVMQIDQMKERYHQREISLIQESHQAQLAHAKSLFAKDAQIKELESLLVNATSRVKTLETKLLKLAEVGPELDIEG